MNESSHSCPNATFFNGTCGISICLHVNISSILSSHLFHPGKLFSLLSATPPTLGPRNLLLLQITGLKVQNVQRTYFPCPRHLCTNTNPGTISSVVLVALGSLVYVYDLENSNSNDRKGLCLLCCFEVILKWAYYFLLLKIRYIQKLLYVQLWFLLKRKLAYGFSPSISN